MDDVAEETGGPSFRERFGDIVCSFQPMVFYLFGFQVLVLLLMGFSLFFVEPGTPSYVILQIDFIIIGITLPPSMLTLYVCGKRKQRQ